MKENNPCVDCNNEQIAYGVTTHQMADILYNMSLDMDYMDYEEHWQNEINRIKNEIEMLKEFDSVLFYTLEMIAFSNMNYLGLLTGRSEMKV